MSDNFDSQFDDDFEEDENLEEDFEETESFEEEDDFDDDFDQEFEEDGSSDNNDSDQEFDKPVDEGEIVEVEIDDLGSKGDGIARIDGFVIFVPGGEVGETYNVEVTSVGRKFAFAEIEE